MSFIYILLFILQSKTTSTEAYTSNTQPTTTPTRGLRLRQTHLFPMQTPTA